MESSAAKGFVAVSRGKIMSIRTFSIACLFASLLLSIPSVASSDCDADGDVSYVCGPENAEDLVHLKGTPWLIGSGEQLHLINTQTKSWQPLPVSYPNAAEPIAAPFASCPSVLTDEKRYHHGITVRFHSDRAHELFVVNHDGRESVEVFDLDLDGSTPSARWKGCIALGDQYFGNAVAVLPEGGLAISVSFDKTMPDLFPRMIAGEITGFVFEWHPEAGLRVIPGSRLPSNNGVAVSNDGQYVYMNSSSKGEITRISRNTPESAKSTALTSKLPVGLADNVHWSPDGTLLVAGHVGGIPVSAACTQSPDPVCAMHSRVMELAPDNLAILRTIEWPGTDKFGAVTSATKVGDTLWFGTLRGNRVAYMKDSE